MGKVDTYVNYLLHIANDNSHGYNQSKRNGNPDFDCSSLVGTALNKAGFNVSKSSTTRNLKDQLLSCGFKSINPTVLLKGDILLKVGSHVVTYCGNNNIVHARIDERGRVSGGKAGDQSGKEICVSSYYKPTGGWDYIFRYTENTSKGGCYMFTTSTVKNGSVGSSAILLQKLLRGLGYNGADGKPLTLDGCIGKNSVYAINSYQSYRRKRGVELGSNGNNDGCCGSKMWKDLIGL